MAALPTGEIVNHIPDPDALAAAPLDLLKLYNHLTGETVAKFTSATVGRDRLFAAIETHAAPPPRPASKPARPSGNGTASQPKIDPDAGKTIHLLVTANPKKPGSKAHPRFDLYRDGMTIADYVQAGGVRGDIVWDVSHNYIKITD